MYRSSPPSAGAWYTIDAALNPYWGRAATLSSIMTATGRRLAVAEFAGKPSSHAKPGGGVGAGVGDGVAVGAVVAVSTDDGIAPSEGADDDTCGDAVGGLDPQPVRLRTTATPANAIRSPVTRTRARLTAPLPTCHSHLRCRGRAAASKASRSGSSMSPMYARPGMPGSADRPTRAASRASKQPSDRLMGPQGRCSPGPRNPRTASAPPARSTLVSMQSPPARADRTGLASLSSTLRPAREGDVALDELTQAEASEQKAPLHVAPRTWCPSLVGKPSGQRLERGPGSPAATRLAGPAHTGHGTGGGAAMGDASTSISRETSCSNDGDPRASSATSLKTSSTPGTPPLEETRSSRSTGDGTYWSMW